MADWKIYATTALVGLPLAGLALILLDGDARSVLTGAFKSNSKLSSPPTQGSRISLFVTFALVILKYLISPRAKLSDDGTFKLPKISVQAPLKVTREDVEGLYRAVLPPGSRAEAKEASSGDSNPLFLLVALTTPLMLQVLCKRECPVLPLGAVNVRNRFDFIDPVACRSLRTHQANQPLTVVAFMGGEDHPGQRVKRGMQFDMVVEVRAGDKVIFKQIFAILQMMRIKGFKAPESAPAEKVRTYAGPQSDLSIDKNAPTRYAAVCKDYNPIHMSNAAAKVFGFARKIVHGNLTAAMVMHAAIQEGQDMSGARGILARLWTAGKAPNYLTVDFKRPIPVPARLQIKWSSEGAQVISMKGEEEKVHVEIRADVS